MLRYLHADHAGLLDDIRKTKDISKNGAGGAKIEDTIRAALDAFVKTFA